MRIGITALAAVALLAAAGGVCGQDPKAGRVAAGEWVEVDADGKPNKDFTIGVAEATPNILVLRWKNGWVAFATFDADKKEYRGSLEFQSVGGRRPEGKWADLYQVQVVVQDGLLRIEGKSDKNEMLIRAKPVRR